MKTQADPRAVLDRQATLAREALVGYWIVLSLQDGYDLLAGRVPAKVRVQVTNLLKRGPAESEEEYAGRLAELT
jgi:hypothetical protein